MQSQEGAVTSANGSSIQGNREVITELYKKSTLIPFITCTSKFHIECVRSFKDISKPFSKCRAKS